MLNFLPAGSYLSGRIDFAAVQIRPDGLYRIRFRVLAKDNSKLETTF